MDRLDKLWSLDPTLEQGVNDHDIGAHLADCRDGAGSFGQDFEQLDAGLRFEEAADVLRDLRDVLDDQQARLVTGRHRLDDTTRVRFRTHPDVTWAAPSRPIRASFVTEPTT